MKRALITGVTGQDGSYLAEYLVGLGYAVFGLVRRSTRVYEPIPAVKYLTGDMVDGSSLLRALEVAEPDEVYNLAADSFVGSSWDQPIEQAEVTGLGLLRLLEAVRQYRKGIRSNGYGWPKVYQASTSELFSGQPGEAPQSERTPFHPRSPYGSAKLFAHSTAVNYRESYGMFVCCGILFNHESPRRGAEFVTQKIAIQAAEVKLGLRREIRLGSLDAKRDWGYAPDYVRAMHLMLQQKVPADYVVATGETHSVGDFLHAVLDASGLGMAVLGEQLDPRPAEVGELRGDPSRINALGWKATADIGRLASLMYEAALARVHRNAVVAQEA